MLKLPRTGARVLEFRSKRVAVLARQVNWFWADWLEHER